MRNALIISIAIVLITSCRERFDFEYGAVPDGKVVVDGFITDRATNHAVRVSYSTTINDRDQVETLFVSDASVRIYDDQGQFTELTYDRSGLYRTAPLYKAEEGRSYRLEVVLANGEVYESPFKTMPPASPARVELTVAGGTQEIFSNNRFADESGARVTTQVAQDGQTHYYQWLTGRYYIFDAADAGDFDNEMYRYCYVRDFDPQVINLLKDSPLSASTATTYEVELDFIPLSGNMYRDYGVEARLLTLNRDDFEFWELVQDLYENSGGLFDAAPFSLRGNVTNSQTGEVTLGYFGVYRESMDRHFFLYDELGFPRIDFIPCFVPRPPSLPHPCMDCRLAQLEENYGINRPEWWGN